MDTLRKEMRDVLSAYDVNWSPSGIAENFDKWENNKKSLVDLLSRHPSWSWSAMAIIFEVSEVREITYADVVGYMRDVYDLTKEIDIDDGERVKFHSALKAVCEPCTQTIQHSYTVDDVKHFSDVKCVVGQKASKVINAICKKYGIDKHTEYNKRFAKLADALNPLTVKKTALLSVHPCDYLQMSSEASSWTSQNCHRLYGGGGEYQGGVLSYMNDASTMIFYTVDDGIKEKYYNAAKRTRQVFVYGDGILLQSRLYPDCDNETASDNYRNLVQKAISDCTSKPNLWELKRDINDVQRHTDTYSGARHYPDYEYERFRPTVSILKDTDTQILTVGYNAYCLDCGDKIRDAEYVHCHFCAEDGYTCANCNESMSEDDAISVNYDTYCADCVEYCGHCNEHFVGDSYTVHDRRGHELYVCESCANEDYYYCEHCHEYHHGDNVHNADNGYYCNECFYENYTCCEECGDAVEHDSAMRHDDAAYCENCYSDNFSICEECDEAMYNTDIVEIDGSMYCADCAANMREDDDDEEAA